MKFIPMILDLFFSFKGAVAAGRANLKRLMVEVLWLLACVFLMTTFLLTALGLLLFSLYQYLIPLMSIPTAGLIVSSVAFVLAGLTTLVLKRKFGTRPGT